MSLVAFGLGVGSETPPTSLLGRLCIAVSAASSLTCKLSPATKQKAVRTSPHLPSALAGQEGVGAAICLATSRDKTRDPLSRLSFVEGGAGSGEGKGLGSGLGESEGQEASKAFATLGLGPGASSRSRPVRPPPSKRGICPSFRGQEGTGACGPA